MIFNRFQFDGSDVQVYAIPPRDPIYKDNLTITFNSYEDFHEIVKRLARYQPDEQVKLAYYALESEIGRRVI